MPPCPARGVTESQGGAGRLRLSRPLFFRTLPGDSRILKGNNDRIYKPLSRIIPIQYTAVAGLFEGSPARIRGGSVCYPSVISSGSSSASPISIVLIIEAL